MENALTGEVKISIPDKNIISTYWKNGVLISGVEVIDKKEA